jgi:2-polyprenyl-6-hydroxyphenyl methylase/3-demethylubiquinone-9 3-methyltransferase
LLLASELLVNVTDNAESEIKTGKRFGFGKNWKNFSRRVGEQEISLAADSISRLIAPASLKQSRFLDAGSGSGLFSAAATISGSTVVSFDFDRNSVECTEHLRKQRGSPDQWRVVRGSLLDQPFLESLGKFDIVYCWGVAHHTGSMWQALSNLTGCVDDNGTLVVSIYNDQGKPSTRWRLVKKAYNRSRLSRPFLLFGAFVRLWSFKILQDTLRGNPVRRWKQYGKYDRGMSAWHDLVDWVGGYPFEVAKPEEIFDFFTARGFSLKKLSTCAGGIGCNEYVFRKGPRSE